MTPTTHHAFQVSGGKSLLGIGVVPDPAIGAKRDGRVGTLSPSARGSSMLTREADSTAILFRNILFLLSPVKTRRVAPHRNPFSRVR